MKIPIFDDQLGLNKQSFCYVENLFSLDVNPVLHIIYSNELQTFTQTH